MWKILSGVAALFLLGAAIFSFNNYSDYQREVELLNRAKQNLETGGAHQKEAQTTLADAKVELEQVQNERSQLEAKLAEKKTELAEKEEVLNGKNSDLTSKKDELAKLELKLGEIGDIKEVETQLAQLTTRVSELSEEVASLKNVQAVSFDKKVSLEGRIENYKQLVSNQASGKMPAIRSTVRNVMEPWGFAIINAGDRQKVVPNVIFDVVRAGSVVGQVRVANVEPGYSAASIVRDSFAAGDTVKAGDVVTVSEQSVATSPKI